jgi:hypothetical protein
MNKITFHLKANRLGPAREVEIEAARVLCNDITLPGEFNPHNTRLWVIGNEYGVLGAVWADCEQEALDELVDADLGAGLLIDEKDADEDSARLGNAGEPACLDNAWLAEVEFQPTRDLAVLLRFAEARGAGEDTLDA